MIGEQIEVAVSYGHGNDLVPAWHVVNPDDPFNSMCGRLIDIGTCQKHDYAHRTCQHRACRNAYGFANQNPSKDGVSHE